MTPLSTSGPFRSRARIGAWRRRLLVVLVLCATMVGCAGSDGSGPTGPSPVRDPPEGAVASIVTVTTTQDAVAPSGGTVPITATVLDVDGNALGGVAVNFTTTAGTLTSASEVSDANGQAVSQLTTSTEAVVTARAGSTSSSLTIVVTPAEVTISLTSTDVPVALRTTDFTVTTAAGANPISDVKVDFGDGTVESLGPQVGTATVSHVYTAAGTFRVSASLIDTLGVTITVTTLVSVVAAPSLNVIITPSSTTPVVESAVTFEATVSPDTAEIATYRWDFGDGTTVTTSGGSAGHAYSSLSVSARTVTVTATAADGRVATAQTVVTVTPPTVAVAASDPKPKPNTAVVFTATVTPSSIVRQYQWNFGDGSATETTATNSVSHEFAATVATTRLVTATVTTAGGLKFSASVTIVVTP